MVGIACLVDLILYAIAVGKITASSMGTILHYCRQNFKHNSNFILKTFANLIEPKMWPSCMARNGGPSVDVRTHSWPGPTVDLQLARANCGCRAIHSQANCRSTVGPEKFGKGKGQRKDKGDEILAFLLPWGRPHHHLPGLCVP